MIEISLASIAWLSVVVAQAYIHFVAIPAQRKRLEEDRRLEEEIRKNMERNGVCNAATYQRSSYTKDDNDEDDDDEVDSVGCLSPGRRPLSGSLDTVSRSPKTTADGLPDPDEDEDLDAIDDGEEESRLKLLKYYYSPSSPDIYSMEPFRSSCGSISSLEEDPDPRKVAERNVAQPTLQQVPPPNDDPAANGVLRHRDVNGYSKNNKDTTKKHVGFSGDISFEASPAFAIHSAPAVSCA